MDRSLLRIDALAAGGDGVARAADGRVVFVPFTVPGDAVRVRLVEERRRFARAEVEEVVEPAPGRREPACPVFGRCGGCAWQHVAYPLQLQAKRRIVRDALQRLGGVAEAPEVMLTPSPVEYGHRARTRLLVRGGAVGYRRRASHALCATSRCPVLVAPLESRLAELAAAPPERDGEWELAAAAGRVRTTPLGAADAGERLVISVLRERIGVSPGVFFQAHAALHETLASRVLEAAGTGERALELFAGAGFFTLGLARRFGRVDAVEGDARAARDLRRNAGDAGLRNVEVWRRRVADAASLRALERPHVALLDPPRSGVPRAALDALADLAPARTVYLSCDPATLARDLRALLARGQRLRRVEAFDLFPQTPHVEALAVLERGGS